MRKYLKVISLAIVALSIVACSKQNTETAKVEDNTPAAPVTTKIVVGASNVPHAEILEFVKPILAKENIDLQIKIFNDYILPNRTLNDGDLDANYFQHVPYFELTKRKNPEYKFSNIGGVHLEPIGLYSKRHKSLADLPDGAKIIGSTNIPDHGRILNIFQSEGLIKLKEGVDPLFATIDDIVSNPKKLNFQFNVEPALTPQVYNNDEADVVVINANFALGAGLDPQKDPIKVESPENNPYVNIIVVRTADKDKPALKRLVEVLQSQPVKDFIIEKYKGAVIPA